MIAWTRIFVLIVIVTSIILGTTSLHIDGSGKAHATSWNEALVDIEGTEYPMNYTLTGATLKSILADVSDKTIRIMIEAREDGRLTIELPRSMIESAQDDVDQPFLVSLSMEGVDDGGEVATPVEMFTLDSRILEIPFPANTSEIRIAGTYLTPEFGPHSSIVVTIAIATLLALVARDYKLRRLR